MILGIAGHIGSGKDTIAAYLVARHGFIRRGWADALKHEVARILPRTLRAYATEHLRQTIGGASDRWTEVEIDQAVHTLLWTSRTEVTRALLQEWGTELRRAENPDHWLDKLEEFVDEVAEYATPMIVIPDTRFLNEVERLRKLGGLLIRVERPGHTGDSHESERALDHFHDYDRTFLNDRAPKDLWDAVDEWLLPLLKEPHHGRSEQPGPRV